MIANTLYKVELLERKRDELLKQIDESMFASISEKLLIQIRAINATIESHLKKYKIMEQCND